MELDGLDIPLVADLTGVTQLASAGVRALYQVSKQLAAHGQKLTLVTAAGSAAQMQDKLGKLRDSGVGLLFIPTMFLGKDQLKPLDAFIEKVAPALRK